MPASAIRKLVPLANEAKAKGIKVYHLNLGAPDLKSPSCAMKAVEEYCKTAQNLSYTDSAGLIELRKALVEKYYRKLGIELDPSEVIVEVAGSEAFANAMQIVADEGDEIIVIDPFYTNYQTFAYLYGITLTSVPTNIRDGFAVPDISEFEKRLTPRTKAVMLSNPCNPSGKLFSKEEMLSIGEFCRKHNLFLISDEVYREFCYTEQEHFCALNIPGCEENVIMIDSISKRYNLCGARIGCIISHNKEVMATAMKYAQSRLCPPALGQHLALGALDTPFEYFEEVKEEYIRRRDCTVQRLNSIPGVFAPTPLGAFYAVAELPIDDAEDFARWMLAEFTFEGQTTMVTPARSFYKTPDIGLNQVRVAYVLEVPELEKALEVFAQGLAAYMKR